MRRFNTSGPNMPAKHYSLPRLDWVEKGKTLVHDERYFTIWAPRQTGKSTYFRFLAEALELEGYKVCHTNFESFRDESKKDFLIGLNNALTDQWGIPFQGTTLASVFEQIERLKNEKCVLIIDEVEGINPEFFGSVLHAIRKAYHTRSNHSLKSVILVGVSNIVGIVKDNASPFNVTDNLNIPYFTDEETLELLNQHERETGQQFAPSVKHKISEITANQPGLVNGFAAKLVERFAEKLVIEYPDYIKIEDDYLRFSLDKNVSNIINKGEKHRAFIEHLLFTEDKVEFQIYRENIKELHVNGIIAPDENGYITFRVPLYRKCLYKAFYPYTNGEAGRIGKTIDIDEYFSIEGNLYIEKVIENYKKYALRRKFRYFREKNQKGRYITLKEATLVYSFETYLNAFLSMVDGKTYLEAHTGIGRTDLIITVNNDEFVVEAKVYSDIVKFRKGKHQLAQYAKSLSLASAIYLVFVESEVTNETVIEEEKIVDGILIKTHLVPYNLDKDF
ncbi:MAG: AAA-like domain-containing protein [Saprospiraceae bacterium]|nr:AAA-like domain-containing protein [Saprospiraceae bacterium]